MYHLSALPQPGRATVDGKRANVAALRFDDAGGHTEFYVVLEDEATGGWVNNERVNWRYEAWKEAGPERRRTRSTT
jgi:hypothetical protein